MVNNKNFLMFVKCTQDALPVDVPIIKISYRKSGRKLRDHSVASKVCSVSFHRIPFCQISNRRCIVQRNPVKIEFQQAFLVTISIFAHCIELVAPRGGTPKSIHRRKVHLVGYNSVADSTGLSPFV